MEKGQTERKTTLAVGGGGGGAQKDIDGGEVVELTLYSIARPLPSGLVEFLAQVHLSLPSPSRSRTGAITTYQPSKLSTCARDGLLPDYHCHFGPLFCCFGEED